MFSLFWPLELRWKLWEIPKNIHQQQLIMQNVAYKMDWTYDSVVFPLRRCYAFPCSHLFSPRLRRVGFGSQQEEISCQLGEVSVQIPQNDVTLDSAVPYCFRVAFVGQSCASWRWSRLHPGALNATHLQRREKLWLLCWWCWHRQGEAVRMNIPDC